MSTFTTFTSSEHGFQIDIPADWKLTITRRRTGSGFFSRLVDAFAEHSVFIAMLPDNTPGFARMGVEVRSTDARSSARQQVEYQGEDRALVAGLPATEAKYITAGTRFHKFAVVHGQREYIIQFGHDGVLSDNLIHEIVASLQFLDG